MHVQNHTCVLLVGPHTEKKAPHALATTCDTTGTWWLFTQDADAHSWTTHLLESVQGARVLVTQGPVLPGPPWVGPILTRLRSLALMPGPHTCLLDTALYQKWHAHGRVPTSTLTTTHAGHTYHHWSQEGWPERFTWNPRTNLSPSTSPILGRTQELQGLSDLLSEHRMVGIHGVAGLGKTRLARAHAEHILSHQPDAEVWWLSLDNTHTLRDLTTQLARLWNINLPGQDPKVWKTLCTQLLESRTNPTVILDDANLLDLPAFQWLQSWMQETPNAHFLLTGRTQVQDISLELHALDTGTIANLIMRRIALHRLPLREDAFHHLMSWAHRCEGHPLFAELIASEHVLDAPPEYNLPIEKGLTTARLEAAWNILTSAQHKSLIALSLFSQDIERKDALDILSRVLSPQAAPRMLSSLEAGAWLMPEPHRVLMPRFLRAFVSSFATKQTKRQHRDFLLQRLEHALLDLQGPQEPQALHTLSLYQADILHMLRQLIEDAPNEAISHVLSLRHYHRRAFGTLAYLDLLHAIEHHISTPHEHALLSLTKAGTLELMFGSGQETLEAFETTQTLRKNLLPTERIELDYIHARSLEDHRSEAHALTTSLDMLTAAYTTSQSLDNDFWSSRLASLLSQSVTEPEAKLLWAERAVSAASRQRNPTLLTVAHYTTHRAYMEQKRLPEARVAVFEALRFDEVLPQPERTVLLRACLGHVAAQLGDGAEARRHLHAAYELARASSFTFGEANCASLLGSAYMIDLEWEMARAYLERSLLLNQQHNTPVNIAQCQLYLGAALAGLGILGAAREHIQAAQTFFQGYQDEDMTLTLLSLEELPSLYEAAWIHQDRTQFEALCASLKPPHNEDVQRADQWILTRTMEAWSRAFDTNPMQTLLVDKTHGGFCPPDSNTWTNISRRRTVRRVFEALITHRIEAPGAVMSAHELFERGWPGETPEVRSGLMRLYVAINTLRKLGLESLLETSGEGYRIRPDVDIAFSSIP